MTRRTLLRPGTATCWTVEASFPTGLHPANLGPTLQPPFTYRATELSRLFVRQISEMTIES